MHTVIKTTKLTNSNWLAPANTTKLLDRQTFIEQQTNKVSLQ